MEICHRIIWSPYYNIGGFGVGQLPKTNKREMGLVYGWQQRSTGHANLTRKMHNTDGPRYRNARINSKQKYPTTAMHIAGCGNRNINFSRLRIKSYARFSPFKTSDFLWYSPVNEFAQNMLWPHIKLCWKLYNALSESSIFAELFSVVIMIF